jgi:hypothetical protein
MPIVRFSAVEQRGLLVPKADSVAVLGNLGRVTMLMVQNGISPERMPADELIDVTPPYWEQHVNTYWVHTEAADPPESCMGFVMPKIQGAGSYKLRADGTFDAKPTQSMRVPGDSSAFIVISPDRQQTALRVHEVILPLPDGLISGTVTMAEQARAI